jgi:hypothetical protein
MLPALSAVEHTRIHIRAVAGLLGFTHSQRQAAAAHLVNNSLISLDDSTGICTAYQLEDPGRAFHLRPQQGVCTCHDFSAHAICRHLLAPRQLEAFSSTDLLSLAHLEPGAL